jgi:hypothetical protein
LNKISEEFSLSSTPSVMLNRFDLFLAAPKIETS